MDGTKGKVLLFPDVEEMHTSPQHIAKWVEYSCFDAEITFYLRETLVKLLRELKAEEGLDDNFTLYIKYWLPFGEVMTDMERLGIKIDIDHLNKIQQEAETEKKTHEDFFYKWV